MGSIYTKANLDASSFVFDSGNGGLGIPFLEAFSQHFRLIGCTLHSIVVSWSP